MQHDSTAATHQVIAQPGVEIASLQRQPIKPTPHRSLGSARSHEPVSRGRLRRSRFPTGDNRAAASERGRIAASAATMPDDMHQGQIAKPQADFGHDDAHLRQRGERQGAFDVGLHPAGERGKHGRQQSHRDHRPALQPDRLATESGPSAAAKTPPDGPTARRKTRRSTAWGLPWPRQPAGKRHQRRFARRRQQQAASRPPGPDARVIEALPSGHGWLPSSLSKSPSPGR